MPDSWLTGEHRGSIDANMRLLRAALAVLDKLRFEWNMLSDGCCQWVADVFESEQVLRPQMTRLEFFFAFQWDSEGGAAGAVQIFLSMRNATAFKNVQELKILGGKDLTTDAFQALGSALGMDALPNLELLSLWKTPVRSDHLAALLQGLERSACAHSLRTLCLSVCGICAEGAKTLGAAIGRNVLPSLLDLDLFRWATMG